VFRWDSQPIGKLIHTFDVFGEKLVKHHRVFMEKVRYKLKKEKSKEVNNITTNNLIKLQKEMYLVRPSTSELKQSIILLNQSLLYLKKFNIKFIFFEMPVNSSFLQLPYSKVVRSIFHEGQFKNYKFIKVDTSYRYITSDGIHLKDNESKYFTTYLNNQINK
jgi:hypothetical protein